MSDEDGPNGRGDEPSPLRSAESGAPPSLAEQAEWPAEPQGPPAPSPVEARFPWASAALIALFAILFAIELFAGVAPSEAGSPAPVTLIAMGGSMRSLVLDDGEWYRMFTATVLHGGVLHLVMNSIALWMAGAFLENVLHRTWFFALFVLGGLGGSALSLATNADNVVSVGASGAIMALLAAACVLAFRAPPSERGEIQGQLLRVLIPSMLPIATGVDYGAHLGGAIVGALAGWALLRNVSLSGPRPGARPSRVARVLVAAGALLFVIGFAAVAKGYDTYRDAGEVGELVKVLIPDDKAPSAKTTQEEARYLTVTYPRDPRGWYLLAAHTVDAGDPAAAKPMLERALSEKRILEVVFEEHRLEIGIRALLAQILLQEQDGAGAQAAAAPACQWGPKGAAPEELSTLGLCK